MEISKSLSSNTAAFDDFKPILTNCDHTRIFPLFGIIPNNLKVALSIPGDVIGNFHWHNPSDRTMALGSTQPLTEMSTRSISWGNGGRCVRLTILPPSCAVVMKSGNVNFLDPSGPLKACKGTSLPTNFQDSIISTPFYLITLCNIYLITLRNISSNFIFYVWFYVLYPTTLEEFI